LRPSFSYQFNLNHFLEKTVNQLFAVAEVSSLGEMIGLLAPSPAGVVQLEVPEEVVGHFEVGTDGEDFVDEILNANDTEFSQSLLDDFVGERASPSLKLSESSLVNEFADRLEVGVAPGDVRVSDPQHAQRCLVQLHESGVVDLTKTEQLEDLSDSGVKSVDTPDSHDDGELGFRWNVEVSVFASVSLQAQFIFLCLAVFFDVLLGALEDSRALGLSLFLLEKSSLDLFRAQFGSSFALLQQSLRDSGEFRRFRVRHS